MAGGLKPKNPKSLHERALGLLAARPRSRHEMRMRLLRAGFAEEEVTEELGRLQSVGLLDDEEFARALAQQAFGSKGSGCSAVRSALLAKGIARETAEEITGEYAGGEEERAEELARARLRRLQGLDEATAYRRLSAFLVRRGYGFSTAGRAAGLALGRDEG